MAPRILLIAGITSAILAGCSQTAEKPELFTSNDIPEIIEKQALVTPDADLLEVSASANVETSPQYRPIKLPPVKPQRKQLTFAIGNDVTTAEGSANSQSNYYVAGQANKLAPTYPGRPVPTKGTSKQEVLASIGAPPSKLPGTAGAEVWDYGTFRVFFKNDKVAFTNVW